jgi:phosphoribosyl-ATP pyrophosphohydrolase
LESARATHSFVPFTFNIPAADVGRFTDLGMKGPSMMDVLSRDGRQWKALELFVPEEEKNAMRALLLERGAEDLGTGDPLQIEVSAAESEVLKRLPYDAIQVPAQAETSDRNGDIADWILALRDTIVGRAAQPSAGSSTVEALEKGVKFCAARYVSEAAELSLAIREGAPEEIAAEAGQLAYWLLVCLQSISMSLEDVIRQASGNVDGGGIKQNLAKLVGTLRAVAQSPADAASGDFTSMFDENIGLTATRFVDQATFLSTALRKGGSENAALEASESLKRLICLVEYAGVSFDKVMDSERGV